MTNVGNNVEKHEKLDRTGEILMLKVNEDQSIEIS